MYTLKNYSNKYYFRSENSTQISEKIVTKQFSGSHQYTWVKVPLQCPW